MATNSNFPANMTGKTVVTGTLTCQKCNNSVVSFDELQKLDDKGSGNKMFHRKCLTPVGLFIGNFGNGDDHVYFGPNVVGYPMPSEKTKSPPKTKSPETAPRIPDKK